MSNSSATVTMYILFALVCFPSVTCYVFSKLFAHVCITVKILVFLSLVYMAFEAVCAMAPSWQGPSSQSALSFVMGHKNGKTATENAVSSYFDIS